MKSEADQLGAAQVCERVAWLAWSSLDADWGLGKVFEYFGRLGEIEILVKAEVGVRASKKQ